MPSMDHLFHNNREWVDQIESETPGFFQRLAAVQKPDYLWIGCADSRMPANEIVGLLPGELFVHRNVGNVVVHTDLNCLSVIQFAVAVLGVRHIIVVGHHRCGAVQAALQPDHDLGLIDNWLRHIEDVAADHRDLLGEVPDDRRVDALCELNVIHQAANVARTSVVRERWREGGALHVHGWVYSLTDGLLKDLGTTFSSPEDVEPRLDAGIEALAGRYR